ncbi:CBS domain-containing protein [Candidatus Nanohalobium constans]|uniref:CBS domain-containing protein n=1 Tax=Candidatus Nanohalobium constans TaxID=2565781 RepID=A0A5Q0UEC1_9ARCH|nr:CBS domain-containing protein [Candidatus Nanohalobium constans]QGA79913.1 CBS domain-containing protein [Candidatus Nanohalobium constans]
MTNEVEISDVMTEGVIAVEQDKSVVEAAQLLEEEEIRGLVVVDNGEAVGIVVCRDIVYQLVSEGKDPSGHQVKDIMSSDLIVAEEDEVLNDVAMAMVRNNVSRVPVVRGDMLVGILTQSDILRAWPGFAEVIGEEREMDAPATPNPESQDGYCESCENYSEELENINGMMVCPECK